MGQPLFQVWGTKALTSNKMSNRRPAWKAGPLHYQRVCTPINEYGWTFYFLDLPKVLITAIITTFYV